MSLQKHLRRILLIALVGVLLLAVAVHFASNYVEKRVRKILADIPLDVSGVDVNLLTQTIELGDVDWTQPNDSLPEFPHHLFVKNVSLEGINAYQLLTNKKLHVDKIVFGVGEFQFNRGLHRSDSVAGEPKIDLKSISVDRIVIKDVYTKVATDSIDQYEGILSLTFEDVTLKDMQRYREWSSYEVKSFEALVTHISIQGQKQMYATRISKVSANSGEGKIEIDSVKLIPKYSKYEFSRKLGRQVDRINVLIPKISINDLSFGQLKDSLVKVASVEIKSAKVHVYRDKRLPFIKEKNTPLPVAMIRDFKFAMAIDSVKITDANITYEEFPENGYSRGHVTFEKLNATIDHITNRDHYPDYKQGTLKATSYIMGKGLLNAEFSLPYGQSQVYNAKGTLKNLSLYRLNPMLESAAFMSVTSGKLNRLTFNFDYTDLKSSGTVVVNYEDLKINSLTKEKEPEKNELKTFVVNTLLRKNKTEKVDKEKRTGTVDFNRDQRRAIFHYWWRSLLTGIKSSAVELPNGKDKEEVKDMEKDKKKAKEKKRK